MKKALSILLTLILTFSCFSILGTVSAEETPTTNVVFSDFTDFSDTSGWLGSRASFVDEDGNGVKDFVRLNTTASKKSAAIASKTFTLDPGTEYELSCYVRVPSTSANYVDGTTKLAPRFIIYQTDAEANGKAVASYLEGQNDYAYDGTRNNKIIRRTAFKSYWTIGDSAPINRPSYSSCSDTMFLNAYPDETPNEVLKDWTKVTATFTAIDDENNVGPATVSLRIDLKKDKIANAQLDIKNLTLIDKSIVVPEEPTPDPEPDPEPDEPEVEAMDFEDETKWGLNGHKSTQLAGYEGHITPEDYMNVTENTDPTYILDGDSSIRLSTNSRWYDYKLTGLKANTKYALKFSYLAKGPKKPDSSVDKNILGTYGIFNYGASDAKLPNDRIAKSLGYLNYVNTTGYAIMDNDGEGSSDYYKNGVRAITVKEEGNHWYTATLYFNTSAVKDTLALVLQTNCSNIYLDKFQLVEVDYTNPTQDFNAPEISGKTKKGPFESENTTSFLYENCTADDYNAYLATLTSAGFAEYATNAYGNNKFATYTKGNTTVHVTYTPNNNTILVSENVTDTLPTTKEQNVYEDKGYQPLIIQLDHNNTTNGGIGMSYIVRLADGSFIIVDGGHTETKYDNAIRLYNLLREYTPTGKIKIAAWLITHCHSDHIGGFASFVERYSNEADIEQVIYNAATYDQFKANADASSKATQKEAILPSYINQDVFTSAIELLRDAGTKISTCHSGYEYNIRNAVINVMFTVEDVFPKVFSVDHNDANNTTSIFKISFTDENVDQTLLITGDSANVECGALYAKYTGDELKSTFVQAIHHAISCGSYELYAKMAPEVILLPAGYSRIFSQLYQAQNQYFIDDNSTVKEIVLSDYGTRVFALPYAAPEGLTGMARFTVPDDIENVNSLETYYGVSIRKAEGNTKQALRFKFGIPEHVIRAQTESGYKVVEYGAMVSVDSASLNYYNGSDAYVKENDIKTFKAISYSKANNKNIVFGYNNYANYNDDVHRITQYTCALYNIGVNKTGTTDYSKYNTIFYVRAYIVFENENGDTKIYYGATQSGSVFDTMQAILDSTETDAQTLSDQAYVTAFLNGEVPGFESDAEAIKEAWESR